MQEQREHAAERGVQVGIGLTLPLQAWLRELASAKRRQDDVAVDALVGGQRVVADSGKAPLPGKDGRVAPLERLRGEVFRTLVVRREPQHAGPGRRFLVALVEVVLDQRRERRGRHDATSPTMAKATD